MPTSTGSSSRPTAEHAERLSERRGHYRRRVNSYYRQTAPTTWEPTAHVQGAWLPDEQHMAPVAGLITHALEQHQPRPDLQLARLSFEILGVLPRSRTEITCHTTRPGRTIELVEAIMAVGGRPVVRASSWRLSRQDTSSVAGGLPASLPAPEELPDWSGMSHWTGGFIESLEFRVAPGGEPGRQRVWLRTDVDLIESAPAPVGDLAEFVKLVDSANGIAARVDAREWVFPNTDLQIHLWRRPVAGWVGLDARSTIGADGVGLTHTVLHDLNGPVGRAEQILTVRRRPT